MANYEAVLKRTLSGFGDPNKQLRSKLYDRARITIRRQLEGKRPPMADDALNAELYKLEEAIVTVEREFDPSAAMTAVVNPASGGASARMAAEEASDRFSDPAAETPQPTREPEPSPTVSETTASEPVDGWAEKFSEIVDTSDEPSNEVPAEPEPVPERELPPVPPIPEIDFSSTADDDQLAIPPVPDDNDQGLFAAHGRKIVLAIALLLAAVIGYSAWSSRVALLETVGLGDLVDNPARPKPVKTITLKPEPEPEQETETEPETAETSSPTEPPKPKEETRLVPESSEPSSPETPTNDSGQSADATSTEPGNDTANPETPTIAVAQTAILYEEGSGQTQGTSDKGSVVWSVVQESPGDGAPPEPAIRARVEIPSRQLVLIMTLKRNSDVALPASHLIELIFAVPGDFSGGTIESINRFVFKENEQSRGAALVAVPAKIADGIFLIALNNLEEARTQNSALMKSRDWIDIPLQYKTGRRALVTIEKGIPGSKVFDEVFEAWEKAI